MFVSSCISVGLMFLAMYSAKPLHSPLLVSGTVQDSDFVSPLQIIENIVCLGIVKTAALLSILSKLVCKDSCHREKDHVSIWSSWTEKTLKNYYKTKFLSDRLEFFIWVFRNKLSVHRVQKKLYQKIYKIFGLTNFRAWSFLVQKNLVGKILFQKFFLSNIYLVKKICFRKLLVRKILSKKFVGPKKF